MSSKELCSFCRLPRADLNCQVCTQSICRHCVQRLAEDAFTFLTTRPVELTHRDYCSRCYDEQVVPRLEQYNETLAKAKEVHYWPRTFRGNIPILKKGRTEIEVASGNDRDETLLRLGFLAAEQGFNALVHGEIKSKKIRNFGYQKMEWSGSARPVIIDVEKLERQEFHEAHWRVLAHR